MSAINNADDQAGFAPLSRSQRVVLAGVDEIWASPISQMLAGQHALRVFDAATATSISGNAGAEVLSCCRAEPPDLLLLGDAEGADALALCAALREEPACRGVPLLWLAQSVESALQGLAVGATDAIQLSRDRSSGDRLPSDLKLLQARLHTFLALGQQVRQLQQTSRIDGITGIANRRYFDERLAAEWRRCARSRDYLGLILIDVDFFRRFNEAYGHQAGDACLRQIAAALDHHADRPGDLVARYGGEEFVCLLPCTDPDGVRFLAAQLRRKVAALNLPHAGSAIAAQVTISLGGSVCVPEPGIQPEHLLRHADRLLYQAKGAGRNRAVVESLLLAAESLPDSAPTASLFRVEADRDRYLQTVHDFVLSAETSLEALRPLLQNGQREEAARRMHAVLGTAGSLGAGDLAAASAHLLRVIREDRPIKEAQGEYEAVLASTLAQFRAQTATLPPLRAAPLGLSAQSPSAQSSSLQSSSELPAQASPAQAAAIPEKVLAESLARLAAYLHDQNGEAVWYFDARRHRFLQGLPAAGFEALSAALRRFDFPAARAALQAAARGPEAPLIPPPALPQDAATPRPTLLLVEDDPDMLSLLVGLLRSDYRVRVATCARQALQMLEAAQPPVSSWPTLILLDMILPDMEGLALCRALKEHLRTRYLPVLMLSAKADIAEEQRALALGVADFVSKPISPPVLLARVAAHRQLAAQRMPLERLARQAQDVLLVVDGEGHIHDASDQAAAVYGHAPESLRGLDWARLFASAWQDAAQPATFPAQGQEGVVFESRHLRRNGSEFPVEVSLRALSGHAGGPWWLGVVRDISGRLEAQDKLRLDAIVFENSSENIIVADAQRRILSVNKAFSQSTGYAETEAIGQPFTFFCVQHDPVQQAEWDVALAEADRWTGEVWGRRKNGETFPQLLTLNVVRNLTGGLKHYILTGTDISARKALEQRFQRLSHYDVVTDLPNQFLLRDHVDLALARARRRETKVAIITVNLERFRTVNESFGHAAGDEVLRLTARRLVGKLRDEDTVARMGADNFTCVVSDLQTAQQASLIANNLLAGIGEPLELNGQTLNLAARVGIAMYPKDGEDAETLLRNADIAAASGKGSVGGMCVHFTREQSVELEQAMQIERGLRQAITRNELRVFYQPKVSLRDGQMIGAEALVRWEHPEHGMMSPALFIPVAERTGQIVAIGEWVLREACHQAKAWQSQGMRAIRISVNVSALQFRQGNLLEVVKSALADADLPPELLELEVTESVLAVDIEKAIALLASISALGVHLSIDDFGTGYSSLSYLKSFPVNTLKIDQSFVRDIASGTADASIIRGITALGHSLELSIIAEGVESEAQLEFLRAIHCDQIQGFVFSRPLPPGQVLALLHEWRRLSG